MPRGSEPGERRGGRKKGTPNKATAAREAAITASGLTPLDYLLTVMRDETADRHTRVDAAKAAAPLSTRAWDRPTPTKPSIPIVPIHERLEAYARRDAAMAAAKKKCCRIAAAGRVRPSPILREEAKT